MIVGTPPAHSARTRVPRSDVVNSTSTRCGPVSLTSTVQPLAGCAYRSRAVEPVQRTPTDPPVTCALRSTARRPGRVADVGGWAEVVRVLDGDAVGDAVGEEVGDAAASTGSPVDGPESPRPTAGPASTSRPARSIANHAKDDASATTATHAAAIATTRRPFTSPA
ncbi:hypothetical protein GCM10023145_17880 [Angustibacter luteus]